MFLFWLFAAVAIVADVFMAAIETITSQKKTIVYEGHEFRVNGARARAHALSCPSVSHPRARAKPRFAPTRLTRARARTRASSVWNDTVANLTLMALGSSAPEILLSVIELFQNEMYAGSLGPSTIVGSAAFNLLGISAVCVSGLKGEETRRIKQMGVFATTAAFSILAYVWLLIILGVNGKGPSSPDVVEPWEGALTFAFFPMLVAIAFYADKGGFEKLGRMLSGSVDASAPVKVTPAATTQTSVVAGADVSPSGATPSTIQRSQSRRFILKMLEPREVHLNSRALYRVNANRMMYGGQRLMLRDGLRRGAVGGAGTGGLGAATVLPATVEFETDQYRTPESAGEATLIVYRHGNIDLAVSVQFRTLSATATAGEDFEAAAGALEFAVGETHKTIRVAIKHDTKEEGDEDFEVELFEPGGEACYLGKRRKAVVTITDEIPVGMISFEKEVVRVKETDGKVTVAVLRSGGCKGTISCHYATEDGTAKAPYDYAAIKGTLEWQDNERLQHLTVDINTNDNWEPDEHFYINLSQSKGGAVFNSVTDGSTETERLKVIIAQKDELKSLKDWAHWMLNVDDDAMKIGSASWAEQFRAAFRIGGDDDDEDDDAADGKDDGKAGDDGESKDSGAPGLGAVAAHYALLPWKLLFATIPPTIFLGGWACFIVSLVYIGLLTGLIGDIATMVGCCFSMPPAITAITIVALGTSLPDTFASLMAAQSEQYADNSIGNITGSNSVNVFLGLGMPWFIGALYWTSQKGDVLCEWKAKYGCGKVYSIVENYPDGAFAVPSGDLGISVTVFVCCALIAIATFVLRRKFVGAELGGPKGAAYASSALFVMLWLVYISVSSWVSASADKCDSP